MPDTKVIETKEIITSNAKISVPKDQLKIDVDLTEKDDLTAGKKFGQSAS